MAWHVHGHEHVGVRREPCGEGWAERPRAEPGAVEKEGAGDPGEGRWVSVAVQSLSMCLREVCGPCDGESLCSVSSRCGFPRKEVVLLSLVCHSGGGL